MDLPAPRPAPRLRDLLTLRNRYLTPILFTGVLIPAHAMYGILDQYEGLLLAVVVSMLAEAGLGRLTYGKWPHLASAYMSGVSVAMLTRSPLLWPYAFTSFTSILSKYALRYRGHHIWNPSNFGISTTLLLAPATVSVLSIQWGNAVAPMVIIWVVGAVIVWRVRLLHVTLTYVGSFLLLSVIRSAVTGNPWLASVAPLTGPMYQLYIFLMLTDPKTQVRSRRGQCVVVFGVALVEMLLRLADVVYAPFYALFLVGPAAMSFDIWKRNRDARVS
jgi:hypothetical protein